MARNAVVLDFVDRIDIGEDNIAIGIVAEVVDLTAKRLDRGDFSRRTHVHDPAAPLVDLVVIADDARGDRAAIVEQQLAAGEPAVAIVDVLAVDAVGQVTVTVVPARTGAEGDGIGDRTSDVSLDDLRIVIAVAGFERAAEFEFRLLGDDRNNAGAGILAEQRRLRAAQHFDALDVGKIGNLGDGAAAINAVDKHGDRRLEADVVAVGAETADRIAGSEGALQLADAERGNHGGQVGDVANLRTLDRFSSGHADGHRHFLQCLFALGRGNDDHVRIGAFRLFFGGIVFGGLFLAFFLRGRSRRHNEGCSADHEGGTYGRGATECGKFHV